MNSYSVNIEAKPTSRNRVTGTRFDSILEDLSAKGNSSASGTHKPRRYTVRFNVDADTPAKAVTKAVRQFTKISETVELGTPDIQTIEIYTYNELDARNNTPLYPEFVTIRDVMNMTGKTKAHVNRLITNNELPSPIQETGDGPLWVKANMEAVLDRLNLRSP